MNLRDKIVLVVDDDYMVRRLVRGFLRDLDCHDVREAENGEAAMPLLQGRSFDLLIFDWCMEPVDGLELIRFVRHDEAGPNRKTPIIVLTGYADRNIVLSARNTGADAVVAKPVSAKSMSDKIKFVLRTPSPTAAPDPVAQGASG